MTTPRLSIPEITESQGGKYLTHNKALRWLECFACGVLEVDLAAEPASPSDGDAYILPSTPTGTVWGTLAQNDLVLYITDTWHVLTPDASTEGLTLYNAETDQLYSWSGTAWDAVSGLLNVVDDISPQLGGNLDVNGKGKTHELTAGEIQANGDWCYLKSDGKMWKTDASAEATAKGLIGVATETTVADATHTYLTGEIYTTTGLTAGATYYLSETSAAITTTAPTTTGAIVRVVGYALSSTQLLVDVDQTYLEV